MLTSSHGSGPLHLHGIVLPDGIEKDVFVIDGHITFQSQEDASTILKSGYLLPGLVDAHAHLALASPAGGHASPEEQVRASAQRQLEHGVGLLMAAGLPQEAALAAGSWQARRYLSLPCIEEGAPADITAYPDDPRGNVEVLSRPALRMLGT